MNNRITPDNITLLKPNEIFVFGSNLAGRHGKGAALVAQKKFGAIYEQGIGPQGKCYAIPFKDGRYNHDSSVRKVLPLFEIQFYVNAFIDYAKKKKELNFLVIEVGCGNAHYTPGEVAPLFKDAMAVPNIYLPESFWNVLNQKYPAQKIS